jgi:predicted CoA-binding protein
MNEKVAILGASDNPERYAYKAFKMLREYGHQTYPVHPSLEKVEEQSVYKKLADIKEPIDTLTMYVGPKISSPLLPEIISLKPKRVIFNPGSENLELKKALEKNNINAIEACTLVLLRTGQF